MAVKTNKYTVKFYHKTLKTEELTESFGLSLPFNEQRRCTIARIFGSEGMIDEYVAVCNPCDNFNKASGRKNSLQGVLVSVVDKEERKLIWEEYQKQFPGRK